MDHKFQQYAQRLEILHTLDQAVLAAQPFETIAQTALDLLRQLVSYTQAVILLRDIATDEVTVVAACIDGPTDIGLQTRYSQKLFKNIDELRAGKVCCVEDISVQAELSLLDQLLRKEGIKAYCNVPLIAENEMFGVLNLGWPDIGGFTSEDVEIAREVANQLAVAIQQARLREQVQRDTVELEQKVAERTAELREERNFIDAILETVGALIVVVDREGRVVRFNRTCEQISGYSFAEVQGQPIWDLLLLPKERGRVKAVFKRLRAGYFPNKFENYWVARDGSRHLISWSNTVLPDPEGVVQYVIGIGIDITARKEAQEEIERSRRWLERIAQTTPDIIFVLDIVNNRNVYANRSILEILGYSAEELGHFPNILQKVIHPDDLLQVEEFYRNMATAKPGQVRFLTHRTRHKDGSIRWIENRVAPFTWDEGGNLTEVIGLARDITERKQMEETLKTHGRVLDNMAEGVLVADEANIIYFTNPAFDTMFGYEPGELSGQNASILNLDPAHTAALFATEINQALESAGVWSGEFDNCKKDGTPFITAARISRLEMPNKTFLVSVQEDITERKQMEAEKDRLLREVGKQRKQLRVLTQQLAETEEAERKQLAQELHDQVGSNLTALGLNLNIIQGQIATMLPEATSIQAHLEDAQALIEQTTERIRNVMANLHPPVLDDYGLVTALHWYSKQLAPRVTFTITVQGQAFDPRLSTSTEFALFRITQEALTNVTKHAQADEVTIKIKADNQTVRLVIADDGCGFDAAQIVDTVERPGWGLLTMVERAERLGGRCRIESRPKEGTRIIVEIPR